MFNVADIVLVVGVGLMFIDIQKENKRDKARKAARHREGEGGGPRQDEIGLGLGLGNIRGCARGRCGVNTKRAVIFVAVAVLSRSRSIRAARRGRTGCRFLPAARERARAQHCAGMPLPVIAGYWDWQLAYEPRRGVLDVRATGRGPRRAADRSR